MKIILRNISIILVTLFTVLDINCTNSYFIINAAETIYDKDKISCCGDVIIAYYGKIISAHKITYNKQSDTLNAEGEIIIKDEKQNVYFLDSITICTNFKSGFGRNIKVIMSDKSRLSAEKFIIKNSKFELVNVTYSPCYECINNNLTWQIKSASVIFDPNDSVKYTNTKFEVLGNTILYLPYISQPHPKIKRKTGFLMPKFSLSQRGGFSFMPQYFISVSPRQELILKPIITSKIGNVGWIYYGNRFKNGEFNIDTSITGTKSLRNNKITTDNKKIIDKIKKSHYRGHIFSKLNYEINDIWRCGFDINLTSDRYYLKKFPFFSSPERILESKIFLEEFDSSNYTNIKASMFQSENNDTLPKILPTIERNFSIDMFHGTLDIDTMFLNLDFPDSRSAQKLSSNISWAKNIMMAYGHIIDFKGLLSLRAMKVTEKRRSNYDSCIYAIPQITASWKWPLLFSNQTYSTIITPIIGIVIASNRKYFDAFEDPFCEINDINIIEGSRAISPYNIDYGNRLCYAIKMSSYKKGKNLCQFILGRSTELSTIAHKLDATGLKYKKSNIVTSLDLFLNERFSFCTKGSYSTQSKRWLKIESGLKFMYDNLDINILAFNGKQCYYDPFDPTTIPDEQKMQKYQGYAADLGWHASKRTKLGTGFVFNKEYNKLIKYHFGIEFKNECTNLNVLIERRNYNNGDVKPDTSFKIILHLKNFGI